MASQPALEAQKKVADAVILERAARVLERRWGDSEAFSKLVRLAVALRYEAERDGD